MSRIDRRLLIAIPLAVAALWWLSRGSAVPVRTAAVAEGPLAVRVVTNGSVEPIEEVEVRARLDGRIIEIPEPGAEVAEGEVILRFDAGPVSSELAEARSERLSAQESLREARAELTTTREKAATDARLFEQGAITRERYRESQAALRDVRARVAFLQENVPLRVDSLDLRIRELEEQLEESEVRAPFAGTVYRVDRRKGERVAVGDPVLWIADLERLRVRANIDQVDLGKVSAGQPVQITTNAFSDRSWSGRVSEVVPHVVVRQSRSISEGLAEVEPPTDGLVPGMSVDVEIVVAEAERARQIPIEAVMRDNGKPYVFRVDGGRARRTPVAVGLETVNAVEILDGLGPEDRVVLEPGRELEDGARVTDDRGA